jgi:hypothetical protein
LPEAVKGFINREVSVDDDDGKAREMEYPTTATTPRTATTPAAISQDRYDRGGGRSFFFLRFFL